MGDKSLVRRLHPVLAVISNCYSEPKGRFPRVTHPCATRSEDLVRLACVRHAASVRSEPGSNSQVHVITSSNQPKASQTTRNFRSRYLHLSNVYGYEGHAFDRLKFTTTQPAQRPDQAGAVAHMSLHLSTMSKNHLTPSAGTNSGGQPVLPDLRFGGLGVRLWWRPRQLEAGRTGGAVLVKRPIWRRPAAVNGILTQICNSSTSH